MQECDLLPAPGLAVGTDGVGQPHAGLRSHRRGSTAHSKIGYSCMRTSDCTSLSLSRWCEPRKVHR